MSILIKSLLHFSQLNLNKKLSFVSCRELIEDVITDLDTLIKESDTVLEIGEMPELYVYESQIRQMFQNLITNSIKFQKKGAGVRPKIIITSTQLDKKWQFSVSDNGIGISAIHFDRVFQIFQRLHSTDEYEGNGIGLANCKKIAQLHQGEIWLESTLGRGTTFYFTISILMQ